jgi:nucleoside-diphosphate-sugar epimerase
MAGEPLVQVDETAPLRPDSPGAYSATKARAEQLVRDAADADLETVVVRPRLVWGAGDTTLVPEILTMVEAGRFAWIGGGRQLTSVTHVDNVVEGLLLGAERGRSGEAYFVTDGHDVVFRDFLSELIEANGGNAPNRSVPRPLAWAVASAGDLAWRILPLGGEPPLPKFTFWLSSQECTIRIDRARAELGYAPVTDRARGMAGIRSLQLD